MAIPIYLYIVYDCFSAIVAEWSSCDSCTRDHMADKVKNIYYLAVHAKSLPTSGLCQ